MRAAGLCALVAVACAVLHDAPAARQDPQPPPRFRAGIDVVVIDVTVLDRNRQPVHGLAASDFTVLEEGQAVPIVSFEEVQAEEPDGAAVAWMREVAPDVRTNTIDNRRLVLVVLDSAGASFKHVQTVKKVGQAVVDRLGPNDLATVLFTGGDRDAQDFTSDRAALRRAIDKYVDVSMPPQLTRPYRIRTVSRAAEYMIAVPHRRKAMIYVGGGLGLYGDARPSTITTIGEATGSLPANMDFEMRDLLTRAQRANVGIYTANPAGLEVRLDGGFDDTVDSLETLANVTGGFAIVNTNSFHAQIAQVFRETGSYYLLGFESRHADGKFRRLNVRVNRPGMTVRTRNGYHAAKPERARPARAGQAPRPLLNALAGILPDSDLPMRVVVAPFAVPGRSTGAVTIVLGLRQPAPKAGDRIPEKVELLSTAFTNRGQPRGSRRQTVSLVLRPSEIGEGRYEVLSRLDLRPGRYNLRFAAHSASLGRSGSVYYDIDVPDFSRLPLSLSGVVLDVDGGIQSAPRDLLAALLPVVPTTQRDFAAADRVTAFVRAYQGGRRPVVPVAIDVRVTDARDEDVVSRTTVLEPDAFETARAADFQFVLPLEALPPGPYLLTVQARPAGQNDGRRSENLAPRQTVRFVRR